MMVQRTFSAVKRRIGDEVKGRILAELSEHSDIRLNILGHLLSTYWEMNMTKTAPTILETYQASISEQGQLGLFTAADFIEEHESHDERYPLLANAIRCFADFHTEEIGQVAKDVIEQCNKQWERTLINDSHMKLGQPLGPWFTHGMVNVQTSRMADFLEMMTKNPIRVVEIFGARHNDENIRLLLSNYRMENIVKIHFNCRMTDKYWDWIRMANLPNLRHMSMQFKNRFCIAGFMGNRSIPKGATLITGTADNGYEDYTK